MILTHTSELELSLEYVEHNTTGRRKRKSTAGELHVVIKQAFNLMPVKASGIVNAFCRMWVKIMEQTCVDPCSSDLNMTLLAARERTADIDLTVAHKCQRPENPQHNSFKSLCCGFLGNTTKWNCCVVDVPTTQRKLRWPRSANVQKPTTQQLKTVVLWVFWTLALVGHCTICRPLCKRRRQLPIEKNWKSVKIWQRSPWVWCLPFLEHSVWLHFSAKTSVLNQTSV